MAAPSTVRCCLGALKRVKLSHPTPAPQLSRRAMATVYEGSDKHTLAERPETSRPLANQSSTPSSLDNLPVPLPVRLAYLRPLRRQPTHGLPVCNLQLRSYTVRNLDFFADFAMRAAYYLGLAARGPLPLPRIVERWTVPKSNFAHKKSQENFERRTCRRLIQIQDADPHTVQLWLAYLEKRGYHGVGMKANFWEYEGVEARREMDAEAEGVGKALQEALAQEGGASESPIADQDGAIKGS